MALAPAPQPLVHTIRVGGSTVAVEVADTEALREQGLSGRASLPLHSGMLFAFDHAGIWGFWMKDMRFALDIIWIDESGKVVTIKRQLVPESYPNVFYSAAPARYVLEVPAGWAQAHGVAEGARVVL